MKSALGYVGVVFCHSGSIEGPFEHLREFFLTIEGQLNKLHTKKCIFLLPEIVFFGEPSKCKRH